MNGMEVFLHVAQTRSFIATGNAKGISSSAVSKSISRLEERLGVRLFQRSTRSVSLTSEGEVFAERCRRIFNEIQAAEDELSAMTTSPTGRLRVGLPYAGGLMLPMISAFLLKYPQIELDLDFSDRLADVIEDGMDVVIRGGKLSDSRLISRPLGKYRLCLVGSPDYFKRRGTPSRPEDLSEHACLHYRYPSSGIKAHWPLRYPAQSGNSQSLPVTMICSSLEALLFTVKQGCGIACLPDYSVRTALAKGELQTVLETSLKQTDTTFHLLWPSARQMTPKVRVFVDFMTSEFNDLLKTRKK